MSDTAAIMLATIFPLSMFVIAGSQIWRVIAMRKIRRQQREQLAEMKTWLDSLTPPPQGGATDG